jgi:hypothetical protein
MGCRHYDKLCAGARLMRTRLAHLRDVILLLSGLVAVGWIGLSYGRATAPERPCTCYIRQPGLHQPPAAFDS